MTTVWIAFSGFSPCLREAPKLRGRPQEAEDCSQVAQEQSYLPESARSECCSHGVNSHEPEEYIEEMCLCIPFCKLPEKWQCSVLLPGTLMNLVRLSGWTIDSFPL